MACGRLLDLVQPEVKAHDTQSRKPYSRNKHDVDQMMTHCEDITIWIFEAAILDLIETEIKPFDPLAPETPPNNKITNMMWMWIAYRMTRRWNIAIRNFPNERSLVWVVGRSSIYWQVYTDLIRYERSEEE